MTEFVQGFSTFILESLVGTELHPTDINRARTREELLQCLRYRRSTGTLSERPPVRVKLLEELLSPWASITYGGCRYLRVARTETGGVEEILNIIVQIKDCLMINLSRRFNNITKCLLSKPKELNFLV